MHRLLHWTCYALAMSHGTARNSILLVVMLVMVVLMVTLMAMVVAMLHLNGMSMLHLAILQNRHHCLQK